MPVWLFPEEVCCTGYVRELVLVTVDVTVSTEKKIIILFCCYFSPSCWQEKMTTLFEFIFSTDAHVSYVSIDHAYRN